MCADATGNCVCEHSGLLDDHKLYVRMQFKLEHAWVKIVAIAAVSFILDIDHFSFSVASVEDPLVLKKKYI